MNNRKILILICALLLMVAVAVSIPSIFAHADDGETIADTQSRVDDLFGFLKEKILPTAISILLSVGSLYIYLRPILLAVKDAVKTGTIQQENFGKYKEESEQQIKELAERLAAAQDELLGSKEQLNDAAELIKQYAKELQTMKQNLNSLTKMIDIAFANNAELVRKGAAKQICDIAKTMGVSLDSAAKKERNQQ